MKHSLALFFKRCWISPNCQFFLAKNRETISTFEYVAMFTLNESEIQGKTYGNKNREKKEFDVFRMKAGEDVAFTLFL